MPLFIGLPARIAMRRLCITSEPAAQRCTALRAQGNLQ